MHIGLIRAPISAFPTLHSHVLDMDIDARVNVVEQVPTDMIRVFINRIIVPAIPAPIGAGRPIPQCDFKVETTGQPEAVVVPIKSLDWIAIRRTKLLEVAVLEWVLDAIARIVWPVVAIPMIVVNMRRGILTPAGIALNFWFCVRTASRRRLWRNMSLVRTRGIPPWLSNSAPATTLRGYRKC